MVTLMTEALKRWDCRYGLLQPLENYFDRTHIKISGRPLKGERERKIFVLSIEFSFYREY